MQLICLFDRWQTSQPVECGYCEKVIPAGTDARIERRAAVVACPHCKANTWIQAMTLSCQHP